MFPAFCHINQRNRINFLDWKNQCRILGEKKSKANHFRLCGMLNQTFSVVRKIISHNRIFWANNVTQSHFVGQSYRTIALLWLNRLLPPLHKSHLIITYWNFSYRFIPVMIAYMIKYPVLSAMKIYCRWHVRRRNNGR